MATKYKLPSYLQDKRVNDILDVSSRIGKQTSPISTFKSIDNEGKEKTYNIYSTERFALPPNLNKLPTVTKKYDNVDLSSLSTLPKPSKPFESMTSKELLDYTKQNRSAFNLIDSRKRELNKLIGAKQNEEYVPEPTKKIEINNPILKFLDRIGTTSADTATYGTQDNLKDKRDTGSKVANTIADIIGTGLGMTVNPTGMSASASKLLSPIGNYAEKIVPKVSQPVVNKILPSAIRGASEFGTYGAMEGYAKGEDIPTTLKNVGSNALGGAVFGAGTKALGMALPKLKNSALPNWKETYSSVMPLEQQNKLLGVKPQSEVATTKVPNANNKSIYSTKDIKDGFSFTGTDGKKYTFGEVSLKDKEAVLINNSDSMQGIVSIEKIKKLMGIEKIVNSKFSIGQDIGINGVKATIENIQGNTAYLKLKDSNSVKKISISELNKKASKIYTVIKEEKPVSQSINMKPGDTVNLNELARNQSKQPFNINLQMFPLKTPEVKPSGVLENRRFVNTVRNSGTTAKGVSENLKDMKYDVKSNQDVYALAKDYVNKNYDDAVALIKSNAEPTAESNAIAQELMRRLQNEGKYNDAIDIVERVAEKATKQGQAIQALSMWSRLSPEGMLKYATKQMNNASNQLGKKLKVSEELAKNITDRMKEIEKMPEGEKKLFETAKVLASIDEELPKSVWRKVSTIQAMAQLLNPKTITRNLVGNTIFGGLENISNTLGTPIDKVLSKMTGKRTTIIPNVITQVKGTKEGFMKSAKEQLAGINTGDISKLDLGTGRTFKKDTLLGKLETGLNLSLKSTDEGFKNGVRQESLRQQMKIAGVDKPTEGMIKIADKLAEYRTFQDTTGLSKGFSAIKDGLNNVSSFFTGTNEWGLGDLVLKYAKTPANILARAIDYSPVGLLDTLKSLPIGKNAFNQKQFVDSISRVATGSSLIAIGYGLNKLGIITGRADKDQDVARYNEQIGKTDYSINFNALARYIKSGNPEDAKPQTGDKFSTWDWAAPASIVLGIGANVGQNKGNATDLLTTIADASAAGINTIFEQPLLSGVKNFTAYGDLLGGLTRTAAGIPSSFTPTVLKQVSQLGDNTTRSTYDASLINKSLNQVKAKTPGVSTTLEPQINTLGKERQSYDSSGIKRGFAVLLNPALTREYKPSNEIVTQIYDATGEKVQFPRVAPKYFMINGEKYNLTAKEYTDYQKQLGEGTQQILNKYQGSTPNIQTANKIQNEITKLNKSIRDTIIKNIKK